MSRDWTPYELHQADKAFGFSNQKMSFWDEKGNEAVWYDPDCKIAKALPNLYFLFSGTEELYNKAQADPYLLEALNRTEQLLSKIIQVYDETKDLTTIPLNMEEKKMGARDWTQRWYLGKLDPNFYYNKFNNSAFERHILKWGHGLSSIADAEFLAKDLKERGVDLGDEERFTARLMANLDLGREALENVLGELSKLYEGTDLDKTGKKSEQDAKVVGLFLKYHKELYGEPEKESPGF